MDYITWLETVVRLLKKADNTGRFSVMDENKIESLIAEFYPKLFSVYMTNKPSVNEMCIYLLGNVDFINFKRYDNVLYMGNYRANCKKSKKS